MRRHEGWFFVVSLLVLALIGDLLIHANPVVALHSEPPPTVDITEMIRLARPTAPAERIAQAIVDAGERCQIDPLLIAAVISTESSYRSDAESVTGARGLMQLVRSTSEEQGLPWELAYDIELNTRTGACYLARHMRTHEGRIDLALKRYNGHDDPLFVSKVLSRYATKTRQTVTVRRGDTLISLATAYLGDPKAWRQLASLNSLADPNRLEPGQVLVVRL